MVESYESVLVIDDISQPLSVAHLLRSGTPDTPLHTLDSPARAQSGSQKSCMLFSVDALLPSFI